MPFQIQIPFTNTSFTNHTLLFENNLLTFVITKWKDFMLKHKSLFLDATEVLTYKVCMGKQNQKIAVFLQVREMHFLEQILIWLERDASCSFTAYEIIVWFSHTIDSNWIN